ncbi:MAG TPA: glycosyltransferase family 4 protein, partial [Rhodanobacteraceae bacterium]|nr:glycosyltransferase family 4 protein [Rhodanobacteraceae bacterium]
ALVLSALATAASIFYARRRNLIDAPGMRRSHSVPTPRGGGIGIVVAIVVCALVPAVGWSSVPHVAWWLVPPVVGIALVGWIDDHAGLSAARRFAVHCAAAAWTFVLPAVLPVEPGIAPDVSWPALAVALCFGLAAVWWINLHNFMDGIDGILALQAVFVLAVVTALTARSVPVLSLQFMVWIAAIAGFVPFNFPRARVFMGDVGSGVLGFLIAVAVTWQASLPDTAPASGLVACSAFVTDATCTLLSRMLRGRRWYSAHREHLYQWLVRCGHSHARVVAFYMGWNLLIVLPVIVWMNRPDAIARDPSGIGATAGVYALATAVWLIGKRRCLAVVRARGRHAAA